MRVQLVRAWACVGGRVRALVGVYVRVRACTACTGVYVRGRALVGVGVHGRACTGVGGRVGMRVG